MNDRDKRLRALVIAPTFFGYEAQIVDEFERQGFETTFIDERPSNSTISRALLRARKDFVNRQIDRYYRRRLTEIGGDLFDVVFVVRAEATPRWFLENLRQSNPSANFVFYIWDAISKATNCLDVFDLFDQRFSFDPADVAEYPELSYLPLFYTPDFAPLPEFEAISRPRRFTLSFIGTLHPGRYSYVQKLFANRPRTFKYFFVQARWYFIVVKYLTREHNNVPWSDVSFKKLTRQQVAEVFRESGAVLDMPQPNQCGLTIRTFEVLASGSILVTTNPYIVHEPFFDSGRVIVVPDGTEQAALGELQERFDSMIPPVGAPESFDQYSLASWVRAIVTARSAGAVE